MNNLFSVCKYGKEYALFCSKTRTYDLFFKTKKEAEKKCKELNNTKWEL